jgi:hypothetical protein
VSYFSSSEPRKSFQRASDVFQTVSGRFHAGLEMRFSSRRNGGCGAPFP